MTGALRFAFEPWELAGGATNELRPVICRCGMGLVGLASSFSWEHVETFLKRHPLDTEVSVPATGHTGTHNEWRGDTPSCALGENCSTGLCGDIGESDRIREELEGSARGAHVSSKDDRPELIP